MMLSSLKLPTASLEFLASLNTNNTARSLAVSLALAKVVCYRLELPSAPVEDLSFYYRNHCKIVVENILYAVVEMTYIDVSAVTELIECFYKLRYDQVHQPATFFSLKPETAICDFFSITKYIDVETLKAIPGDYVKLMEYTLAFSGIVEQYFKNEV